MDFLLAFTTEHTEISLWLFGFLIILGGLNVPISEDIVMISAGAFVANYLPESALYHYIILFFICWIAAWETYWIGRLLGPKLYKIRWFNHILSPKKVDRLHDYYEKFGIFTFFIGRFIPGGVRNGLFMTAGLGKMPFKTFILRDLPACFLSTAFLFYIGYFFAQHKAQIINVFSRSHIVILAGIGSIILLLVLKKLFKNKKAKTAMPITQMRD